MEYKHSEEYYKKRGLAIPSTAPILKAENQPSLSIGDVVKLKSGSPRMTLYLITDNGVYWTKSYENGKWKEMYFKECELKKIE